MADEFENDTVKSLRERGDKAEARAKELEKQVAAFQQEIRTMKVAPVLRERGVSEKVASLIPGDVEDIGAWLDEYGFKPAEAAAPVDVTPQPQAGIDPAAQAQLAALQRGSQGGIPDATGLAQRLDQMEALKTSGLTGAALQAEISRLLAV